MSNLTIVNWCPGDPCDPCKPPPTNVGHYYLIGAQPFGICPPVCPFSWESGNFADEGMLVAVTIQFSITGTDTNPTFSISGAVPFTGIFHYSQIPCPAHDIGRVVDPIQNIAITSQTRADYGSPFTAGSGYWEPGDCQVQAIAQGTSFGINVYTILPDGSKYYTGAGGGFGGG